MAKVFIYVVLTMTVKQSASMAGLLAMLSENKSIEILDRDEIARRIIIRAAPSDAGYLELLVEKYAASASFEIKAYTRRSIGARVLNSIEARYIGYGARLLFYWLCNGGAVYGERKQRSRLLLKYCRKTINADPANIPYSLCSFNPFEHRIVTILENARKCFEKLLESLAIQEASRLGTN